MANNWDKSYKRTKKDDKALKEFGRFFTSSEFLFGIIIGIISFIFFMFLSSAIKESYGDDNRNAYFCYLATLNIVGFFLMGIDKKQALKDKYRIPNKIIMGMALLGGPLGIFTGTTVFFHKSLMPRFKLQIGVLFFTHLLVFLFVLNTLYHFW
jgi:uncharacterized membrane protein YsdA (DUF1294 family)